MYVIRLGEVKHDFIIWSCSCFLRISKCFRRYPPSKRNWIIAGACFIYLFYVVSQVVYVLPTDRLSGKYKYRGARGIFASRFDDTLQETTGSRVAPNANVSYSTTPKYNVVYITLKSKRRKPAIIRGTIRPKLRKKTVSKNRRSQSSFINEVDIGTEAEEKPRHTYQSALSRKSSRYVYNALKNINPNNSDTESHYSAIRIYSERAPPWFSKGDIEALRFLADSKISGIKEVSFTGRRNVFLFESMTDASANSPSKYNQMDDNAVCQGRCALIKRPLDTSEVFAFHLDRILGLNRSIPAACRRFTFFEDDQPSPVVLWDPTLAPADNEAQSSIRVTWGSYQHSLKDKCWHRGAVPTAESGCSSIHHYEWSRLALFDFLLQVYNRLDRNCCGFKPRKEDTCVKLGRHQQCSDPDSIELVHIIHRKHDPRRLVLIDNKGYFDRDEDNLNFKLLEGIKELPEHAVSVLRSHRLREKLLQSLFLDEVYWESQGGRLGIEKLIDVIEKRAKVLLTYINAHGIKIVPMSM
ncbi:hypothetical protein COCON_G00121750 [Conger conger]|uniref:Protein FAM198B n=1 Tax=Conger conger TaxID=82655 RepID=A0A9Q1DH59_CONCO|nr:Golgi-associated kinase 1B [Conger conger]KAJ8269568.1 hypothetical protein COCON_G00121750 [Conger conger]